MLHKWLIYRRLPWVRVVEIRDCGVAVFVSIARYYGHHITLEHARTLVGADRDGTTLAGLRDGGRAIGLDARPAHATYDALAHVQLPAIAHTEGREGHFVVLYRWSPQSVVILDPNSGLSRISRAEFEAQWSGYVVEYRPTEALKPRAPDLRPYPFFGQFIRQHAAPLLLALCFALVATSLGWASSFFLRVLIDDILPQRATSLLLALGAGLVLLSTLQALLQLGRLWLLARVGRKIHHEYAARYIDRLMTLPMKVFDVRCVPGLVMRVNQTDAIQMAISEGLVTLVSDGMMFLGALAIIAYYEPVAALIALSAVPLIVLVMVALNDRVYNAQLTAFVRSDEFSSNVIDTFDNARTIKVFSAEQRFEGMLSAKLQKLVDARYTQRIALALPTTWSTLATSLVTAGILWYGSLRVMAGAMSLGELIVLFGMIAFYLNPVQRLPSMLLAIRGALIGIERMEEIIALPAERDRTQQPVAPLTVRGRITFENVSFEYKPRRPVLKQINLQIEAGETVAIVGETGSGKTSLANLVAGFYLPSQGDVCIDGISTRNLIPEELRRSISAVFQDSRLFQLSLRENITMLDDAPLQQVREKAQLANAAGFIEGQLRAYETQVARGGTNFSSGQAQRVALTRALMKDAPILILDEATSNLDGATEQAILQALDQDRRGRTTLVIAHRLSTVLHADRIFVMDQGQIVEAGTHDELLSKHGQYYRLFRAHMIGAAESRPLHTAPETA